MSAAARVETVDVILPLAAAEDVLAWKRAVAERLKLPESQLGELRLRKHSIDARKSRIKVQLRIEAGIGGDLPEEPKLTADYPRVKAGAPVVVIVGSGPAGMFAALRCLELGRKPIVLERGVTFDAAFHDWANEVYSPEGLGGVSLLNFRKDILVTLMNLQGVPVRSYKVYRCWPSAYTALPELSANDNAVAIQSLTLQNEGWELDDAVVETAEF